mgnify:CR=1 FL=1
MGRKVGGSTKHTKVAKKVTAKYIPKKTNITKHGQAHVYRPAPNYTTTQNKQGLKHTTGTVGASYGVTQTAHARELQNRQRLRTINLAHKVRHVIGGGGVSRPHVPVTVKTTQAKQHQVTQGRGQIVQGNKKFIKKKLIRPKGAGQNPVYMNPFDLGW